MAQDTSLTALSGGSAVAFDCALKVYHRTIDFAVENLANGDHFQLFTLPAGAQVLGGICQITTLDAGGGTISIGVGGTGTELLSAQATSAATCATLTAGGVQLTTAADTIDLSAGAAALTTAVAKIWLLVVEPNGAIAHG